MCAEGTSKREWKYRLPRPAFILASLLIIDLMVCNKLVVNGDKWVLHSLPSCILYTGCSKYLSNIS